MQWNQYKGQQRSCMNQERGEEASVMILGSALPSPIPRLDATHADKTQEEQRREGRGGSAGDGQQGLRPPLLATRNGESLSVCANHQMTPRTQCPNPVLAVLHKRLHHLLCRDETDDGYHDHPRSDFTALMQ